VATSRLDRAGVVAVPAAALGLAAPALAGTGLAGQVALVLACAAGASRVASPLLAGVALAALLAGSGLSVTQERALRRDPLATRVNEPVSAVVTVTGAPQTGPFGTSAIASTGGVDVLVRLHGAIVTGERLRVSGVLERPREPVPGVSGFDERAWLARQGVHEVLRVRSWERIGRRGGVQGAVDRLREGARHALLAAGDDDRSRVVEGILLGGSDELAPQMRDDFRRAGLQHILAVSGGNVALLVAAVLTTAWLAGLSRALAQGLAIPAVLAYALVVGPSPSVVRAATAGIAASLAWLVSRPTRRWQVLALGAAAVSALDPFAVLEPGFQLSFAAVAAIFLLAPRIEAVLDGVPFPRRLRAPAALSLACTLATAPIAWAQFGRASLGGSVPANLLALPALAPLLWLALAAAALWPVAPAATVALDAAARAVAEYVIGVARLGAWLDGALPPAVLVVVVLACVLVRAAAAARRLRVGLLLAGLCGIVGIWSSVRSPPPRASPRALRVTVLDVGQGSATLLDAPGGLDVLVDAGPAGADVAGQLARLGVRQLDLLVLSHPQSDHVGGAADVIRRLHVARVLDPEQPVADADELRALAAARDRRVPVVQARAGERFARDGVVLRVLAPTGPLVPGADPNAGAVVIEAVQGSCRILVPADAESPVLLPVVHETVSVLVVSHHGSADDGLPRLLARIRPQLAIVSVGARNRYGHPAQSTLAALAGAHVPVRRTDRDGSVTATCP
jgi:competence protein ComEC